VGGAALPPAHFTVGEHEECMDNCALLPIDHSCLGLPWLQMRKLRNVHCPLNWCKTLQLDCPTCSCWWQSHPVCGAPRLLFSSIWRVCVWSCVVKDLQALTWPSCFPQSAVSCWRLSVPAALRTSRHSTLLACLFRLITACTILIIISTNTLTLSPPSPACLDCSSCRLTFHTSTAAALCPVSAVHPPYTYC